MTVRRRSAIRTKQIQIRMNFRYIIICLLMLVPISVAGQESVNNRLALEYFRSGEFEKAADMYADLYRQSGSAIHFDYLLRCLTELKEYPQAIKLVRQQMKRNPAMLEYYVSLGQLYEKSGDAAKAKQQYDAAVKEVGESTHQIVRLGEKFMQEQLFDYAVACFLKGQKLYKNQYRFHTELGEAYYRLNNYPKMIAEYIAMLDESEAYVETVQSRLQQLIYSDLNNNISPVLRSELLVQIQKSPAKTVYSEMLIWLFVQQKEFAAAFVQASALDRRLKEDGARMMDLGEMALGSSALKPAADCFEYVITKGKDYPYYSSAREKSLKTQYLALQSVPDSAQSLLVARLRGEYQAALSEPGLGYARTGIVADYAEVLMRYARDPQSAIQILDSALRVPGISSVARTELEMQLAGSYLFDGDIWESNLIFARIERFNSHSPIGHEAKFMRAKIAYYSGDFKYAEALLDILKAGTSKLIANDAFELALLINENTALDTSDAAMRIFARADYLLYQQQPDAAMLLMDSVNELFPGHSLDDDILYRKAQIFEQKHLYETACEYYQKVISQHSQDILADNALYRKAQICEEILAKPQDAMELYRRLITEYPSSIFVPDARERYRKLRGDAIN